MTRKQIIITGIIAVLLVSLGASVWYRRNNIFKMSANRETSSNTLMISTTTPSGNVITIEIVKCPTEYNNDIGVCFGSGRSNYTVSEGVWLYDLVSNNTTDRFGGGFINKDDTLYIVTLSYGLHNLTDKEYEYYRKEIIKLLKSEILEKQDLKSPSSITLKNELSLFMSKYSTSTTQEEISNFNKQFINYEKIFSDDKVFIDQVINFGVGTWGPCFGIPEGECRE